MRISPVKLCFFFDLNLLYKNSYMLAVGRTIGTQASILKVI